MEQYIITYKTENNTYTYDNFTGVYDNYEDADAAFEFIKNDLTENIAECGRFSVIIECEKNGNTNIVKIYDSEK